MNNKSSAQFTLEQVLVSPFRNELEAGGRILHVQPKVMEVLDYLARHYDRVIPKEELVDEVWAGRVVTHGSVQKSINLLRKALAELLGEREVIAHYSKKGYQLKIEPVFLAAEQQQPSVSGDSPRLPLKKRLPWRFAGVSLLCTLMVFGAVYLLLHRHTLFLDKTHRTEFQSYTAYTSELGYEAAPEPHPENRHLAYVRQFSAAQGIAGNESQLVIRDSQGRDWQFASSEGRWVELAWSPSGDSLVAVELTGNEGQPLTPDFYSGEPRLYDIHVFRLDLTANRVLEKHRLSQWQGHISSASWWDESTIELVARQGDRAVNRRYRYSVVLQRLDMLKAPDFVNNPLLTRIHRQHTAMASLHNGTVRVDFLAPDQTRYASHHFDFQSLDLSWIPDGSGVLIFSEDNSELMVLYRDGEVCRIESPRKANARMSGHRYSADGQKIFYAEARPRTDVWAAGFDGSRMPVADNGYWNYAARFSPDGEELAYVSVRNNQTQVWLVEDGEERQISQQKLSGDVDAINWTADGDSILYQSGSIIYRHHLPGNRSSVLLGDAGDLEPLALSASGHQLLVLRSAGEVRNLWRVDLNTGNERQLTFGSVGSAIEHDGDVYFNYSGQTGLWILREGSSEVELLTGAADKNTKLLGASDTAIFYITGGECRESDIYRLSLDDFRKTVYLAREEWRVSTHSFHPERGALYSYCDLPESDILVLTGDR